MKDLREEGGTKACIVGKIVKSRMKWAGHMKDDKLPKRAETKKQEDSRKRGRPQLRWEVASSIGTLTIIWQGL